MLCSLRISSQFTERPNTLPNDWDIVITLHEKDDMVNVLQATSIGSSNKGTAQCQPRRKAGES
jgi:hypothetical protein